MRHELPKTVRSTIEALILAQQEPNEAPIISDLVPLIHDCQEKVFKEYQKTDEGLSMDGILASVFSAPPERARGWVERFGKDGDGLKGKSWSPTTSSDSGYGSEERGEAWRVRDTSLVTEEKEKGIRDWDLYPDAWDEMDEAIAWQREF
jgi:hypothetical protein